MIDKYTNLLKKYKKLIKHMEYIIKISDKYQKNLIKTRENLKSKINNLKEMQQQLEITNQNLNEISSRDQLTGLYNRREFEKNIKIEWRNAIRELEPISLIMLDIDNFKLFNDNYGHLAGDHCLQKISKILQNSLRRPRDFLARFGGEEFIVILPNTDQEGACYLAKNLRKNVENAQIPHRYSNVSEYVTISLGVGSTNEAVLMVYEELLDKADKALYKAKEKGRNVAECIQL